MKLHSETIRLTSATWEALWEQAERQGEQLVQPLGLGIQHLLPQCLGEGGDLIFNLRGGLTLQIRQASLKRTLQVEQHHEADFPLVAKFYLTGACRIQTLDVSDIESNYPEIAGYHYLYHLPNQIEIEEWPAAQPLHLVMIFAQTDYFGEFPTGNSALSQPLQKLLSGDTTQRFHQSLGLITPTMKQVLQQILHCPYGGLLQHLYLESKALELLALQFAAWNEVGTPEVAPKLQSHDIDQLHQARELLIQQVNQPPSLTALARQVGLNDRKLKQGFRQLFGTTVFGYLQNYRMEQAQLLLRDADFTVAQVALQVGYTNPEAFSTAFRRKFAVSPKAYQLGQRY